MILIYIHSFESIVQQYLCVCSVFALTWPVGIWIYGMEFHERG